MAGSAAARSRQRNCGLAATSGREALFRRALGAADTETAWRLLSEAAEASLGDEAASSAKPHGAPGRPYLAEAHFGKTASVQALRERKLRRAARRVAAALAGGDRAGEAKLNRYLQHLADVYPDLGEVVRLQGPALLTLLQEKAAEEEKRANRARLDKWAQDVQTDLPRLARWVKASCAERPTSFEDFAVDPDPQAKAEAAAVEWQHLWSRHRRPDGVALHQLLTELQLGRAGQGIAPPLRLEGNALLRRAVLSLAG